jgi:hypothetical protein
MILWYWDSRNYGRLVDFYFDTVGSYIYPNTVEELTIAIGDTSGGTLPGIRDGIIYVTDSLNGYDFQSQISPLGGSWNQHVFSWIKNEIDNGRPFLWCVLSYYYSGQFINLCVCGVGYIIAPPDTFVIVHNTWSEVEEIWPLWTYNSGVYSRDYVITVVPGGVNPDNIFITFPTDSGFVFQYGDTVNITWDSYGSEINYVKLWYASHYDSTQWTLIDPSAPNTGTYPWVVPEESLYARINLQAFNAADSLEAADGSFYNFIIQPTGIVEQEVIPIKCNYSGATFISGPLLLPEGKKCKVFDITGRVVASDKMRPGIYFIKIDKKIIQKVIKIK